MLDFSIGGGHVWPDWVKWVWENTFIWIGFLWFGMTRSCRMDGWRGMTRFQASCVYLTREDTLLFVGLLCGTWTRSVNLVDVCLRWHVGRIWFDSGKQDALRYFGLCSRGTEHGFVNTSFITVLDRVSLCWVVIFILQTRFLKMGSYIVRDTFSIIGFSSHHVDNQTISLPAVYQQGCHNYDGSDPQDGFKFIHFYTLATFCTLI